MTPMVRTAPTRTALILAALMVGAAPLAGCGFTPLYAASGVTGGLSSIALYTPDNRTGFMLKQSLQDELATNPSGASLYRLDCAIAERRAPRGVRVNNVANRYEIDLTVSYELRENVSQKVVLKGSAPVIVTYDSSDPPYAGVQAAQDGNSRAAQQAAIQIRLALSRFFAGRPAAAPAIVETPATPNPQDAPGQ